MATVTTSSKFTLNSRDVIKGLIIAVILPVLTIIQTSVDSGTLTFNWKAIAIAAVSGFVAYIIKNFLSPAEIVITNPPEKVVEAVKSGESEVVVTPT